FLNVVKIVEVMTHYWWMHWFWITLFISFTNCETIQTTLHSISTDLPLSKVSNDSYRSSKAIGRIESPPTTINPSVITNNITAPKNFSLVKSTKPSLKKIDLHFQNLTTKNTTKENKETVINPKNSTYINNNATDNHLLINSSITAINDTNNLTYLGEEINNNQSSIQNSQRIIDVEEDEGEEEGVDISGGNLSAAGITGITLGCVIVVGIICGVSYFLYRNRGFNRPQVLNDRCSNPDSSGYIDDASVRDNSEEMYSLDNDSFLNSLEAMTIQNYWTDTVKHTKL
ncbi:hypothetical protein NQ314_007942, partial [Rhamnusium bicolor]